MKKIYAALFTFTLLFWFLSTSAQIRTVRGVLVDPHDGSPLPGVSIVVKGSNQGTTTDAQGRYELKAPVGSTLVISYIGYTTQEVVVPALTGQEAKEEQHLQAQVDSLEKERAKIKTFRHTIPDTPEDKTLSPYFFVQSDDPATDAMPLKSTSASVQISGVIAQVTVRQVYVNEGKNALEAMYIFPGSTRAAVYGLTMQIGNRRISARIREKAAARQEYEQAIQAGKSATLLEQKRPNVFQMNVGNILPQDTIAVELQYTELLLAQEGTYEFVYPTVVGPRYSETPDDAAHSNEKWVQNPYLTEGKAPTYSFDLKTRLNAGLPIQKVYCPSHQVNVNFVDSHTAEVSLAPTERAGGNRDYVLQYRLRGGKIESGLLLHPGPDENFFLLMLQPPDRPTLEQIPPREYVFIVDVSGSMHGFPLDVSKQLMRKLLGNLRPEDRFNVILFAGTSNIFSGGESVPATSDQINRAMHFIDRERGSGGTSLLPALKRALTLKGTENYARTFVLLSDGYVDVEKQAFELVRRNLNQANFFAFGIGTSVNRYLMEGLAHAGMGAPFFASSEEEARKVGNQFREVIENPVLTNIKLDFGGLNVYDVEPLDIPDVFVERPIVVFGKYKGVPTGSIRLSGVSGQSPYSQKIDISSARRDHNEALRYLWARERIKYWDDYAALYEDGGFRSRNSHSDQQRKAIVELGLKYNLLTAYTSFIAVDSLIRAQQPPIEVKQPLPLPKGVSNYAVGGSIAGVQIGTFGSVMGLAPDIKSLSEVMVTGYGTQTRRSLVCSVSTVSSASFELGQVSSPEQALQGRVSGVMVSRNTGSPGGSTSVRIRGNSSVTLSNSPLYVVDGIVVDNSESDNGVGGFDNPNRITDIPAEEIESIQVLKGASASAQYGCRGAQGVVLITTRNGRNQRGKYPKVSLSSSVAAEQVNRLPEVQQTYAQGRSIDGAPRWQDSNEPFSWGPRVSDLVVTENGNLVPKANGAGMPVPTYSPDAFFRPGLTLNHSIRMGHDKERTRWSIAWNNQYRRGILPNTDARRNTIHLNAEQQKGPFLLGLNGWYVNNQGHQVVRGNDPSGVLIGLLSTPATFNNEADYLREDGSPRRASEWYDNPYWSSQKNGQRSVLNRWLGHLYATYDLASNLQVKYEIQADRYTDERTAGVDLYAAGQPNGRLMQRQEDFLNWQTSLALNYNQHWNDFTLNAGIHLAYRNTQRLLIRTDGTQLRQPGNFSLANALTRNFLRQDFRQHNRSLLSKTSLNWRSQVHLDLSLLSENTSTMPSASWLSPSIGLSAQLLDLLAIESQVVSSGKLYTSYSLIRKEAPLFIDPNLAQAHSLSLTQPGYMYERQATDNTSITQAESNAAWELGTAWAFFNGRLSLEAVHYRTLTRHLYIPVWEGSTLRLQNGGTLLNQGWEIDLKATPVTQGAFTWNTDLHFTRYQSVVQSLAVERVALAGFASISSSLLAGQPYGVLYGTRYLRNEQGQKVIGTDGFPLVDSRPGVLGNPNPDWLMGLENRFRWKGWEFSFLFDFRQGGLLWNGTKNTLSYLGLAAHTAEQREIRQYVFEGVSPDGKPNATPVDFVDNQTFANNRWVRYGRGGVAEDAIEKASWLRLRQLSLGYTFPRNLLSRFYIEQLSLSLFAQNLWLSTPYTGIDPETNLTGNSNGRGLDYFNTPNLRSIGGTVRVGF